MNIIPLFAAESSNIIGTVQTPFNAYGAFDGGGGVGGITLLIANIIRVLFVVAGIWALFNFILAGFKFISAGGDSKKISAATSKIYQTMIGLIVIVGSFAFITFFSYLFFGRADFILKPQIYGP